MATANPPSDIRLADKPNHDITIKAMPIERGMEIKTKKVALTFTRNKARMMMIKMNAINKASTTVCTALVIRSA